MLVTLQKVGKSFGAERILQNISAAVDRQDRIGIIGENGAGKTTLLRILTGELLPDEGEVSASRNLTFGYLEQNAAPVGERTVWGEMEDAYAPSLAAMEQLDQLNLALAQNPQDTGLLEQHAAATAVIDAQDAYHREVKMKKVLAGMAFLPDTWEKEVRVLSGGERTRLQLAKLLVQNPDLLILDEPTNHLDFETLEWLESYLTGYGGAILAVSHDRYFLDAVANRIWELEQYTLTSYKGNYSAYLPQKEMAVQLQSKQHDADVATAKKLQDYVDRNLVRASTTKMAQSRRKQLEKMEITEKPHQMGYELKFRFEYDMEPYENVLTTKKLCVAAGGNMLIDGLNLEVLRGDRLVIAGANGTGKSTLLRVLCGKLRAQSGSIKVGTGVKMSVFEQQQRRRGGRVIDAIWDQYPRMTELEVRSHLARLNFKGEDVFKETATLSGGELSRLRFAEILLERPNLLFLDEPTNHLDIYTRESLGQALARYTGTLLLVTHDRYLMNSLACPILHLEDGKGVFYDGYAALMARTASSDTPHTGKKEEGTESKTQQRNPKEERRLRAEVRKQAKELEQRIEELGADILGMEESLSQPEVASDHLRLQEICDALGDARFEQNERYAQWEALLEEHGDLLE